MPETPAENKSAPENISGEIEKAIIENKKLTFPVKESNKSRLAGKIRYWWS
jgi:hypothetical protein